MHLCLIEVSASVRREATHIVDVDCQVKGDFGGFELCIFKNPYHRPVFCQDIMKKLIMHICRVGKWSICSQQSSQQSSKMRNRRWVDLKGEETDFLHSRAAVCCQTCGPIRGAFVVNACAVRLYVLFLNTSSGGSREQMEALWRIWPLVSPHNSRRRFMKRLIGSLS